jgi:hypothetical protein
MQKNKTPLVGIIENANIIACHIFPSRQQIVHFYSLPEKFVFCNHECHFIDVAEHHCNQ